MKTCVFSGSQLFDDGKIFLKRHVQGTQVRSDDEHGHLGIGRDDDGTFESGSGIDKVITLDAL